MVTSIYHKWLKVLFIKLWQNDKERAVRKLHGTQAQQLSHQSIVTDPKTDLMEKQHSVLQLESSRGLRQVLIEALLPNSIPTSWKLIRPCVLLPSCNSQFSSLKPDVKSFPYNLIEICHKKYSFYTTTAESSKDALKPSRLLQVARLWTNFMFKRAKSQNLRHPARWNPKISYNRQHICHQKGYQGKNLWKKFLWCKENRQRA